MAKHGQIDEKTRFSFARDISGQTDEAPDVCSLLVVDDNELNRDLLSRRLKRHGYDVSVATGGAEAIESTANRSGNPIMPALPAAIEFLSIQAVIAM